MSRWRSDAGVEGTAIMGSSMGGLISLHGLISYPQVFGGAGCLSTHWPVSTNHPPQVRLGALRVAAIGNAHLEFVAGRCHVQARTGFTSTMARPVSTPGTQPFQERMNGILADRGYRRGTDSLALAFPGADHDERSCRARLATPMAFLLQSSARP